LCRCHRSGHVRARAGSRLLSKLIHFDSRRSMYPGQLGSQRLAVALVTADPLYPPGTRDTSATWEAGNT
jgi:hypothetical protein